MFTDFERPRGTLILSKVDTLIGSLFLATCALWAAMFIWNITTGNNPITRVIVAAVGGDASTQ